MFKCIVVKHINKINRILKDSYDSSQMNDSFQKVSRELQSYLILTYPQSLQQKKLNVLYYRREHGTEKQFQLQNMEH